MADPISAASTAFAAFVTSSTSAAVTASIAAGSASFATLAAYTVAYVGLSAAVSVGLSAVARSQLPDVEGQKVTRKQPRPERIFAIGGPSRMSGAYMLRESNGNKYGAVQAVCEGRLASIDTVYVHDDIVTRNGDGWVAGMAGEKFGSGDLLRIQTRLGDETETHYSMLTADFGSYWATSARGDGVASVGIFAQHRSRESFARHFPNGEPMVSVVGTPVCYDWRDVAQDRLDETTWQACSNPIVWLVHCEWARHGRSWDRCIEPVLDDLTDEADYCDETIDGEVRYQVAGNYPVTTQPQVVRGQILASMDGWMSVDGRGRLVVKAGRYVEPTFILTGEHIRGYSWKAFQTDEEAINELIVSHVSAALAYTETEVGTVTDEDDVAARGKVRSEPLSLPLVPRAAQAMRLARRKMTRLGAQRRGQVRASIYGLNGLGQRYIRVQNPELTSMADVVVEVMNVEIDFPMAEVIFDVILADTTIDDDETVDVTEPSAPGYPTVTPGNQEPAVTPISRDVLYPTTATSDTISVSIFNAVLPDGSVKTLPADDITADASTSYGIFYRDDVGYQAVPIDDVPAFKATGSYIFVGFQSTPDSGGTFEPSDPPPGGWGGGGSTPLEPI